MTCVNLFIYSKTSILCNDLSGAIKPFKKNTKIYQHIYAKKKKLNCDPMLISWCLVLIKKNCILLFFFIDNGIEIETVLDV